MQIQSRLYMGNTEDTRSEIKRRVQNRNLIKSNYFYGKFYLVYQKKEGEKWRSLQITFIKVIYFYLLKISFGTANRKLLKDVPTF